MLSGQGKQAAKSAVERLRGKFANGEAVQAEVEDMAASTQPSSKAKAGQHWEEHPYPRIYRMSKNESTFEVVHKLIHLASAVHFKAQTSVYHCDTQMHSRLS